MDFDFTQLLLILVVVTGALWLFDLFYAKKRRAPDAESPFFVDWGASFFPVLALVFILRGFLFEPFQIPSGSMIPTLEVGDFIVVSKFSYGVRLPVIGTKVIPVGAPERGDVAVFVPPHVDKYFIKRVIGIPGDRIKIENNQVWVNDEVYSQKLISNIDTGNPYGIKIQFPEGEYFMMGDNRDNSEDSRAWGTVPEQNLVGQAKVKWMHWESWGSLPSFSRVGSIQ